MKSHYIITSSSYSTGKRICLDYVDDGEMFSKAVKKISAAYDGKRVAFSTHMIHTDSQTWESVVTKDPYFSNVSLIESVEHFVRLLQEDRYLNGADVAKYILSKSKCTHTRLQKLTYMCYADYLCSSGDRLFLDKIYAFDHGPVIETVYSRYSEISHEHPRELIASGDEELPSEKELPMKSRILFSEDGFEKLMSIDSTLSKYMHVPTEVIVEMTHKVGSPWYITPKGQYAEIRDDDIIMYHDVESVQI